MNDPVIRLRVCALEQLERVVDSTPVECFGGPDDGEFRRADENEQRSGGMYVVVCVQYDNGEWRIIARRWVPDE